MDNRVGVYVGTYGKYNEGYLDGKWMYPADYDTLEDFLDACYELHSDEDYDQIELMFQDCDNLPSELYSESSFSEEAFEYAKFVDENPEEIDAAKAYIEYENSWDEDDFESRYVGEFDTLGDFAQYYVEENGGVSEAITHSEYYFDFAHFGRELKWDLNSEDEYDAELLAMSDYDCGEAYINDVYGDISELSPETMETYFDYDALGRDMQYDGSIVFEDGFVFWGN